MQFFTHSAAVQYLHNTTIATNAAPSAASATQRSCCVAGVALVYNTVLDLLTAKCNSCCCAQVQHLYSTSSATSADYCTTSVDCATFALACSCSTSIIPLNIKTQII